MFVVPLIAAFVHPDLAWTFKLLVMGVIAVSAASPMAGLLVLVLLLPFSTPAVALFDHVVASSEITDALLLAFVSGASLRVVRSPDGRPDRLSAPAIVLMAAVVASTIAELHALQAITPRRPLAGEIWRHLTTSYWTAPRTFAVVHDAVRWIAWIAAAVYAERAIRAAPARHDMACRLWIVAGTIGAMFSVVFLLEIAVHDTPATAWQVLQQARLSVLQPDLNAAGSYFALFLVPAVIVGLRGRAWWMLVGAAPVLMIPFGMARSRAAMAAVVLVLCVAGCARAMRRPAGNASSDVVRVNTRAMAGAVAIAAIAAAVMFAATRQSHLEPRTAVQFRLEMMQIGLSAAQRNPLFGVGLGDYIRSTRRFITPETPITLGSYPGGENAHNNLLQIVVELGIPAGLVFLWLVIPTATMGFGAGPAGPSPALQGLSLGVAAFLVSAVFGHPLLVPQVGVAFFLALGVAAGLAPAPGGMPLRATIARAGVVVYAALLVLRLA